MQLLVSDANIFIDLEEGELLEEFFLLPFEFITPDILFYEELEENRPYLLEKGLKLGALDGEDMNSVMEYVANYSGPSRMDCMALVLAKKEECPLLSGDRALVAAAKAEGVLVNGSIWIIEQLIEHELLDCPQAYDALDKMRANGRRLPWDLAKKRIKLLEPA